MYTTNNGGKIPCKWQKIDGVLTP